MKKLHYNNACKIYPLSQIKTMEVNFSNELNVSKWYKFNFIKVHPKFNLSRVLANFHVDICQIAFTNDNLYCTQAALRSFETQSMISYQISHDYYNFRSNYNGILKYYIEYGFKWLVPLKFNLKTSLYKTEYTKTSLNNKNCICLHLDAINKDQYDRYDVSLQMQLESLKYIINFDYFDIQDDFIKLLLTRKDYLEYIKKYNFQNIHQAIYSYDEMHNNL